MHSDLIAKLEALDGPDPEVDAEICIALQYGGKSSEGATNVRTDPDWDGDLLFEIGNEDCCNSIPELTASLDAAVALVERMLPGQEWSCGSRLGGISGPWAKVRIAPLLSILTNGSTPTIALLIAALKALEARDG